MSMGLFDPLLTCGMDVDVLHRRLDGYRLGRSRRTKKAHAFLGVLVYGRYGHRRWIVE